MFPKLLNKETQRMALVAVMVSALMYIIMSRFSGRAEFMRANRRARARASRAARKENYALKPRAVMTTGETEGGDVLSKLPYKAECTPGLENGAYYSKSLTPGGFCGDQAAVNAAMHKYTIDAGIGGSLMDE